MGRRVPSPSSATAVTKGGPLNPAIAVAPSTPPAGALERAVQCACVAEDNKARDILVLDMRKLTPLYDFFILVTGTSRRQIHTIAEEIDAYQKSHGEKRQIGRASCGERG